MTVCSSSESIRRSAGSYKRIRCRTFFMTEMYTICGMKCKTRPVGRLSRADLPSRSNIWSGAEDGSGDPSYGRVLGNQSDQMHG